MNPTLNQLWSRFQKFYFTFPQIGLALDLSRIQFEDSFLTAMKPRLDEAFRAMDDLEHGAIANPDEDRMVGHYWLRTPELAPTAEIRNAIEKTKEAILLFSQAIHSGTIQGENGPFANLLVIGIGGSALGPQFVAHALGHHARDKMRVFFIDNTDPDGIDNVLAQIGDELQTTLVIVISKSGATKETRNGMIEVKHAFERKGLSFARHAVAITGDGSQLDSQAKEAKWLKRFPMWDWVGGRTSETSAVGLLPAALQGIDIEQFLRGASECDAVTRNRGFNDNPAAAIALAWFAAGNGRGQKHSVVLPYKDRLEFLSRYLQQLVMESLGKEKDLAGLTVHQGLAVFGNKGSTDQHAYVQQLRDGPNNFFATFIEVLKDRDSDSIEVEPGVTAGDYLFGFLHGTRQALFDKGRESITITLNDVLPFSVGVLIALFERAVGIYASLIKVNAYHQPGVEAGKVAADAIIKLQRQIADFLWSRRGEPLTVGAIGAGIGDGDFEMIFKVCEHLSATRSETIKKDLSSSVSNTSYKHI